jgi:DNA polymerase III subunit alpha
MGFVHLHIHSEYSLLEGACRVKETVAQAKLLGFSSLAITDKNVLYGVIPFYKACQAEGIRPIIGMELSIDNLKLVLLAKNNVGYRELIKLSTYINCTPNKSEEDVWTFIESNSANLIALTPGLGGAIERLLLKGLFQEAVEQANKYKRTFTNRFYFSLQNHQTSAEAVLNERMTNLAKQLNIECVVTNNVFYLNKEDATSHDCLLCIRDGVAVSDENRKSLPSNEYYLKSSSEMEQLFPEEKNALKKTSKIAEMCQVTIPFGNYQIPTFPLPDGETGESYLRQLCEKGLKYRYESITAEIKERLNYELKIINDMQFNDYFLIVWDFMRYAHNNGILTGPGRGSAAGSLVAYVLKITDVDPIKHQLFFERFLNPERISMPDIDIDFEDTRRDEVIQYVAKKYGNKFVAQIVTFGTLAAKAVIRDVGRALAIEQREVDRIAKLIPTKVGITLKVAVSEVKALQQLLSESEKARLLLQIAEKLEGLPRHTSTHAAGVIISQDELTESVPLQSGQNGLMLTQYPMDNLAEIGLLKMDFLGLRNLTLLNQTAKLIEKHTKQKFELTNIPLENEKAFQQLSEGNTTGVFQLESAGMRRVLQQLKPTQFEDIVAVNALYRPGPMESIPAYIEAKHGKKKIVYPHPALEPILKDTYGFIVYQEQIMQVVTQLAGFSLGQADLLRRAVSKKKKEDLDEQRQHFVNGCIAKGYDEQIAHSIYDLIVKFANYGFNRSHAVAYSMIAYQLAYLKANYPLMFTAALLSSAIGNEERIAQYVTEAKVKKVTIHPPSINKSFISFSIYKNGIQFSLAAIKNVGATAVRSILQERKKKPFADFYDFCARIPIKAVNRRTLESLIYSGCFDEFNSNRASLLASIDPGMQFASLIQAKNSDSQLGLFPDEALQMKPKIIEVPPFSTDDQLQLEKEALGFYLSGHPVNGYDDILLQYHVVKKGMLQTVKHQSLQRVAGLVTNSRIIRTKKGEQMAFITLSDETGEIEVVIFPNVYKKAISLIHKGKLLFIEGTIENNEGSIKCLAKEIIALKELNKNLFIKVKDRNNEKLEKLKHIIKKHQGFTPVTIYYESEKRAVKLAEQFSIDASEECIEKMKQAFGDEHVVLVSK